MRETNYLEFKRDMTNSFLKTVSAFSNYSGGMILFGVDDDSRKVGVPDPKDFSINLENKINDSIVPQPDYSIEIEDFNIVVLKVEEGINKPYMYKSKAYKRNDSATIEVDTVELTRLILEGKNLNYEELKSEQQEFTFNSLEKAFKEKAEVECFNTDTMRTLNLYFNKQGYNNAAAIFADENRFPGIDLAVFGADINIIKKREIFNHCSILDCFENAMKMYNDYYTYEEIKGALRKKIEKIPEAAFREAIANGLIHRNWDTQSEIRVLMFDDKIEIISPSGLPSGIEEDEYLTGKISRLRNPIIGSIMYRLGYVEMFGTGILRIKNSYKDSCTKPVFDISSNAIKIVLPVIQKTPEISYDEQIIYHLLSDKQSLAISDIVPKCDLSKSKVTRILKNLNEKELVRIEGRGRGTKYRLV